MIGRGVKRCNGGRVLRNRVRHFNDTFKRSALRCTTSPIQPHNSPETVPPEWLQPLLDVSEGTGYDVNDAGLLGQPVAWGDQDSNDHVNSVTYIKYFETGRFHFLMEMFKSRGLAFNDLMSPKGIVSVFRSAEIQWRRPIQYPDRISVIHKIEPLTAPDRYVLKGVIVSHQSRSVACRIKETLVTVDSANGSQKCDIPPKFKAVFEEWARKSNPDHS
ncbi:HotDog domain-containing protein [Yarrowia lipolytica]|jgi:YbgC/YbaW family acyl-CoA thioester hydrolase|uniref:YALI0C15230p n=2 Tax=Yarrowia lipolytica TaxID=4952 RepID=B5FVC4_YARLI|nr:YALI0C15230p [Yarrowia lipolytica CLIB122]AOW02909.1 hypothetical protein YALI1_C21497g [Yarrowia lipolytica]KAB8280428.1 HotDog domain-containing protein [Yarrowia lipolytica]KAE8169517.1 HotDog domain-containing protein [Yarrowia lipolytica]KAJ8053478.1 HotDog domain-containing protein [Yarrowia lipolytica]RDW26082.1 HotDog domain-containing protein [Yarrowia lipolytica]|eukprot:XP_002143031.1 YALI0C15230p [Yarrowia lipolytica CLIB122]